MSKENLNKMSFIKTHNSHVFNQKNSYNNDQLKKLTQNKNFFTSRKGISNEKPILARKDEISNDDLERCLNIMSKQVRSMNEILALAQYLETLDEFTKLVKISSENYRELLVQTSCSLRHESHKKNRIIFKYGDKSLKYYIILRGSVSIIKPISMRYQLTENEFILYLITLRKYNESEIIIQLIHENKELFTLEDEFEFWLKNHNIKFDRSGKFYERIMNDSNLTKALSSCIYHMEFTNNNEVDVDYKEYISRIGIDNLLSHSNNQEKKSFLIFRYDKILDYGVGCKFGDIGLGSFSGKRTATIITNEQSDFGTLDKVSFDLSIREINEKEKNDIIDFFLMTGLFYLFNRKIFEIKIFHLFVLQKINRNEKIYSQGDEIKKIYFIKNGDFELTARNNLIDFNNYYKPFGDISKVSFLEKFKENEKMESNPKFRSYLNNKMLLRISIAKRGDILGLEDMIVNKTSIFTIECLSAFGEVYSIDKTAFGILLENHKELCINYKKFVDSKVLYLVERLKIIRQSKLRMFDTQNSEDLDKRGIRISRETRNKNLAINNNYRLDDAKNHKSKNVVSCNSTINTKTIVKDPIGIDNYFNKNTLEKQSSFSKQNSKIKISPNKKTLILSLIHKNSSNALSLKEDTIISDNDVNNSLYDIGNNINEENKDIKSLSLLESKRVLNKKKMLKVNSVGIFEERKLNVKPQFYDFSLSLQNYFRNHVKINRDKESLHSSINKIDILNVIDKRKNERENKLVLSKTSSILFEKNRIYSRLEKKLVPINIMRKRQKASKSLRNKNKSLVKEDKFCNQMKIVNINSKNNKLN